MPLPFHACRACGPLQGALRLGQRQRVCNCRHALFSDRATTHPPLSRPPAARHVAHTKLTASEAPWHRSSGLRCRSSRQRCRWCQTALISQSPRRCRPWLLVSEAFPPEEVAGSWRGSVPPHRSRTPGLCRLPVAAGPLHAAHSSKPQTISTTHVNCRYLVVCELSTLPAADCRSGCTTGSARQFFTASCSIRRISSLKMRNLCFNLL